MPSRTQYSTLRQVRRMTTPDLVREFLAASETRGPTLDDVVAARWLALATLGELFARAEHTLVPMKEKNDESNPPHRPPQ